MNRNYQLELEQIIQKKQCDEKVPEEKPTLLLHSCCAPCSSHCMEYLRRYFRIILLYYNPNITNSQEYEHRVAEQSRLINCYNEISFAEIYIDKRGKEIAKTTMEQNKEKYEDLLSQNLITKKQVPLTRIEFLAGRYEPSEFLTIAKGYETVPEGGERCFRCYRLRLTEAALVAKKIGADYFTTTLTISPLKNAQKLNEIGEELSKEYDVAFLPSDFKKKNGYKRSIELSKQYNLYRQDFCGCAYSKAEREAQKSREQE